MQQPSNVRIFNPPQIHKPVGYSHVAEITQGKMIYVAGQVALDASGNLVGKDDLGAQTRQVFANLKTALEAAGADFSNVVKLNYYLVENDADAPRIAIAFEEAERTQRPVVVLVGDEYHGFNR